MAPLKPIHEDYYLWMYVPSKPAAVLFAILFSIGTGAASWRTVSQRGYHCIPFVLGGLFEIIGYSGRAAAETKTDVLALYLLQAVLTLLAPALFAATIYMTLGRLMHSLRGQRHSLVPVRWLAVAFVCGDIGSFCIQGGGAAIMASGDATKTRTGQHIVVGGLVLQTLMLGLFMVTTTVFHVGMQHWPSGPSLDPRSTWRRAMAVLYVTSVLIMLRSVFRAVESGLGHGGYPLSHEWTLYLFDAVPMLAVMGLFTAWFPMVVADVGQVDVGWESLEAPGTSSSTYRVME